MPTGQFDTPKPSALIKAMQKLANKAPVTAVNRLYVSTLQNYTGIFVAAEGVDANLSQVILQGGATIRFVPKLSSVGTLVAGDVVKLEKSGSQVLHITGKLVGNFTLASGTNPVAAPGNPTSYHTTSVGTTTTSVAWTAGVDHYGTGLRYNVFINGNYRATTGVGVTSYTFTGLTPGTGYGSSYVTATDGLGNTSLKSNMISWTQSGNPPTPPGTLITKTYKATGLRSYNYSGNLEHDSNHDGAAYQGSDQHGGFNQMGIILFPSSTIRADMAGGTPVSCTVGVTYAHFWYSTGGTASIGFHGYSSFPSKADWFNYEQGIYLVSAKAGNRISHNFGSGHAAHWQSGQDKGISIGPAPGTYPSSFNPKYYGYTYGLGTHVPTITLSWTTN